MVTLLITVGVGLSMLVVLASLNTTKPINPFLNKFVRLTLKQPTTVATEANTVVVPTAYQGFLLHQDDDQYFLGDNKTEIAFAVPKTDVTMIEIMVENLPVETVKGKTFMVQGGKEHISN
jgi:hypothetical protein